MKLVIEAPKSAVGDILEFCLSRGGKVISASSAVAPPLVRKKNFSDLPQKIKRTIVHGDSGVNIVLRKAKELNQTGTVMTTADAKNVLRSVGMATAGSSGRLRELTSHGYLEKIGLGVYRPTSLGLTTDVVPSIVKAP